MTEASFERNPLSGTGFWGAANPYVKNTVFSGNARRKCKGTHHFFGWVVVFGFPM
jgi:hypothetical protein